MPRPILCLDFDGVLHSYESGWQGAGDIPDPPVPGAMAFLADAVQSFRVAIYSTRTHQPGGVEAMQGWLKGGLENEMNPADASRIFDLIEWPLEKPPAMVTIDDRALTFTGAWPAIDELLAFRPWNRGGSS